MNISPYPSPRLGAAVTLLIALAGYLGPWIPHKTAALTVTGFELAEFAKFFPQVQGGTVPVDRMLFYLPLVAVAVLAAWYGVRWARWLPPVLVAGLVMLITPYSVLDAARLSITANAPFTPDPAYLEQLLIVVGGAALTLAAYRVAGLPARVRRGLRLGLAVVSLGAALWQFALVYPLFAALYGHPTGVGWGVFVCAAGLVVAARLGE